MRTMSTLLLAAALWVGGGGVLLAAPGDEAAEITSRSWSASATGAASEGAFLPLTMTPTVPTGNAMVSNFAGYDGGRRSAVGEAAVEVGVWRFLAVRAGAVYSDTKLRMRPSLGARAQLLNQQRHGVGGAIGVFYRPEGLTEPEGEVETVVSLGRRVGAFALIANVAYGQDPEGNERDGELRAATFRQLGDRTYVGLDGRWRFDLGSHVEKLKAANEPTFDLVVGPVASVLVGPFALSAQAGVSVLRRAGASSASAGVIAMGGVGTAF